MDVADARPVGLELCPSDSSFGVTVPLAGPSVPDPSISSSSTTSADSVPVDDFLDGTYFVHRLSTREINHVRLMDGGIAVESSTRCKPPSESS